MRIDQTDLVAMARRANSLLTDEGAKNWYQTDVRRLLNEVVALRNERAEALQAFQSFMSEQFDDNADLPRVAEKWREQASGLWEKAQVKKLKAQLDEAKADATNADRVLELLQDTHVQTSIELTKAQEEIEALQRQLREQSDTHAATVAAHLERIEAFEQLARESQQQLDAWNAEMQRRIMADAQSVEQLKISARQQLVAVLEMLS